MDFEALILGVLTAAPSLAILILLLVYRKPIVQSFSRLHRVRAGSLEAEFAEIRDELNRTTVAAPDPIIPAETGDSAEYTKYWDGLCLQAVTSPVEAIFAAWNSLLVVLGSLAGQHEAEAQYSLEGVMKTLMPHLPRIPHDPTWLNDKVTGLEEIARRLVGVYGRASDLLSPEQTRERLQCTLEFIMMLKRRSETFRGWHQLELGAEPRDPSLADP